MEIGLLRAIESGNQAYGNQCKNLENQTLKEYIILKRRSGEKAARVITILLYALFFTKSLKNKTSHDQH